MPQLRIALAQIDHTVGDLAANARSVLEWSARAARNGAHLVAFPEMIVTGYPPEDLVLRPSFRAASRQTTHQLARDLAEAGLGELAVVVGYCDDDSDSHSDSDSDSDSDSHSDGHPDGNAGGPRNAAAFLHGGRVVATYFKHHLPNYGVFDERRYFRPGDGFTVVRYRGVDLALTICEDAWQEGGPFAVAQLAGAGLVVNINGSPYERNKDDLRLSLLQRRAVEAAAPVAYVNTVGGQDELVFDGDSFVVDAHGQLLARAAQYVEELLVVDLELASAQSLSSGRIGELVIHRVDAGASEVPAYQPDPAPVAEPISDDAEIWGALVLGVRDYVRKNGFRSVVLGMSGGIDSAVVAAIAADAIGGENVYGVSMPSAYSSEHSKSDAADLAERIGAHYREVAIKAMVEEFVGTLSLTGVPEENVQARIRGTLLMAVSNSDGHLVLATGNKSELAVGYTTIYDAGSIGGFSPLKDVPKSLVWRLARWRNAQAVATGLREPIPPNSISKPPSAELRPGQLDSDSLPDYEVLDAILARYVDADQGVAEIVAAGFDAELVTRTARMVDTAEWKRRQYPPGTKISLKAFGRDRRLPITNRWREG